MDLVDLCRELEDGLVAEKPNSESLKLHEAVLSLAIGCGGWLLRQIRERSPDIAASGQTQETLSASLELVRILYRSRHPDFTAGEIEAARQRIFNAAA